VELGKKNWMQLVKISKNTSEKSIKILFKVKKIEKKTKLDI